MSKKLIVIIVGLFVVQIAVYTMTHIWSETELIKEERIDYRADYYRNRTSLLSQYPDYKKREIVYLNNKNLTEFPKELLLFKQLKYLYLAENNLTEFPYEVLQLEHLELLNLNNNKIWKVDLTKVDLTNNSLSTLNINDNKLTEIKGLEKLKKLKTLSLKNNQIKNIALYNEYLSRVDLSFNNLNTFPKLDLIFLETVLLNNNNIDTLDFTQLSPSVMNIELQNNRISQVLLPTNDINSRLENIDLSNNDFTAFPIELLSCWNLRQLRLTNNKISSWNLSETPINTSLEKLNLSDNGLVMEIDALKEKIPNLNEHLFRQ